MDEDLTELADAGRNLLAEARAGGFGPPQGSHWDAEHVLAHLLVNERLLLDVTRALAADEDVDYDNAPSQDGFVLASTITEHGDLAGLAEALEQAFAQHRAALQTLAPTQLEREVPARVWHEGHRVMDEPLVWWSFAVQASAGVHLPRHTAQLQALRP